MKKSLRAILIGIGSVCFALGLTMLVDGCKSTLAPGGTYNPIVVSGGITNSSPDMGLFVADSTYQVAYNTINAVFVTEKNNRDLLWKVSPDIKHTLDGIRPQALDANRRYLAARAVYIDQPNPGNLNSVTAVLDEIKRLATAAQAALPKGN